MQNNAAAFSEAAVKSNTMYGLKEDERKPAFIEEEACVPVSSSWYLIVKF